MFAQQLHSAKDRLKVSYKGWLGWVCFWVGRNGENKLQSQHPGFWKANPSLYINEKDNKHTYPKDQPFIWTQGRQVGGRSLTWGGITLRMARSDFKSERADNYYPEWPIRYEYLEPHYTNLEKFLNVYGSKDGLEQLPDGNYLESLPFTNVENEFREKVIKNLNFPVIHSRGFNTYNPKEDGDWPKFSSVGSSLKKALKTGKVEILSNHIAEYLVINKDQSYAEGLVIIDRLTGNRKKIESKKMKVCTPFCLLWMLVTKSSKTFQLNLVVLLKVSLYVQDKGI